MNGKKSNSLASSLRRRISIQTPVRTPDGGGGYTQTWQNFATVFANIEPSNGREKLIAFKLQSEVSHKITIRYLDGVKGKMRVVFGAKEFNIRAIVNPGERNEKLILLCDEGSAV